MNAFYFITNIICLLTQYTKKIDRFLNNFKSHIQKDLLLLLEVISRPRNNLSYTTRNQQRIINMEQSCYLNFLFGDKYDIKCFPMMPIALIYSHRVLQKANVLQEDLAPIIWPQLVEVALSVVSKVTICICK
jgi:hypothetical protein